MNNYTYDELKVGLSEEFKVIVDENHLECFKSMSGDINPMHTDDKFAREKGFQEKIVYGMCTASFYSKLVGVFLPGQNCLFKECNVSWPNPTYVGDELTISGKIKKMDNRFKNIYISAFIKNQDGKKVSRAKLVVGVLD